MKPFISITDHAKRRSLERYGILPDTLLELAQKSIIEGYSTGDAPNGKIRRYLQSKIRGTNKAYVYSGYVFIFSEDLVLITTFRLPMRYLMSLPRVKTHMGK